MRIFVQDHLSASPQTASSTGGLDKKTIYGWTLAGPAERLMPFRNFWVYKYSLDQRAVAQIIFRWL
jgi:hypothetical protein